MKFLRISLVVLALCGVSVLGYYAYHLATDTLQFAFRGTDRQIGDVMRIVAKRPNFLSYTSTGEVWDVDALSRSLVRDGMPWDPTVSSEGAMWVSGEYVEVRQARPETAAILTLDAGLYNQNKKTNYRLPHSVELRATKNPYNLMVSTVGLPSERLVSIDMYGYPGLGTDDVRFYMQTDPDRNCRIEDAWDSRGFHPVRASRISTEQSGQRERATYRLDYDSTTPRVCMIAGIGGDTVRVIDRTLTDFALTGAITSVLSPEYDMQSEIEFSFSHDVFADTGALYSSEYLSHRTDAKREFLKHLDITPSIPLTEDQVVMTPSRATIVGDFREGTHYTIKLKDMTDIYGRHEDLSVDFRPESVPFLSIALPSRRTMFRAGEDITARLYALKTPKDTYTMKLCRISLEGYARAERLIAEGGGENIDTLYSMLDRGVDATNCTKSDIMIASGSTVSQFRLQDMYPSRTLEPGLYILAPREKSVARSFDRMVLPRVFSVIDSQITMKVDASGKMTFLVTDLATGAPRSEQSLTLRHNILQTYTESWDRETGRSIKSYLPFTNRAFATGSVVGKTAADGTLRVKKDALDSDQYSPPYSLMQESSYEHEGRYDSFLATAEGGGHFGYVVSTWNDGITGWNFGLKESDYAWDTRSQYSAYIHTDRRLYLPGEKVYIHAIVRENRDQLTVPAETNFIIKVTGPMGGEVRTITMKPNAFGTIALDLDLTQDAQLGNYMVQIQPQDESKTIENGYTNFQVEVFKNPTFTADVKLKSPDIENDLLLTLRKKENTDPANPWYQDVYTTNFSLDGIVRAHYYNGAQIRGVPFTYRIYRAPYYDASYWGDCFWGCYYESSPEFYTEGSGAIDQDGMGIFHVPVEFSSFYNDYVYTAEVSITDPMTGESVVTPSTLLARIPLEYKEFDPYNPLQFTPEKRILHTGETLSGALAFQYGKWDNSLKNKYQYELIHRQYDRIPVDDLRVRDAFVTHSTDRVMLSGSVITNQLSLPLGGLSAGEYHLRISPVVASGQIEPESSMADTLLYIAGDFTDRHANLRVIPEKTVYHQGEIARILISTPFTGGYLYLTRERGGVIDHEYVALTGSTLTREYRVDDTFVPNLYIGAVAYPRGYTPGGRNYAVGYGEIVTDLSDKKGTLTITPDKDTYKNRDTVNLTLQMQDRTGSPLQGEIAVMVVDESLIRLLGNIDLDIIPKFFRKAPFTMKTALTAIGMDKNRFLSRKGANGGSGNKGGDGLSIASRILFKNTAYYNPSVRTDASGQAKVAFSLPDNVTDYRIITIGQTQSSVFSVAEKTIGVRRDYTLEAHVPSLLYPGDTFEATFSVFNSTKKITNTTLDLTIGSGSGTFTGSKTLLLQAMGDEAVSFTIPVSANWQGDIPYTVTLTEKGVVLDSVTRMLHVGKVPLLESITRHVGVMTGGALSLDIAPITRATDRVASFVSLGIARSPLTHPQSLVESLITYPYGCVEQTIASTLPNAIALKFSSLLGLTIDTQKAQENLHTGLAKILRMQHFGGWKYWENDSNTNIHVTPYVLRALYDFRDMGVDVPQPSIDAGLQYLVDTVDYQSETYRDDPDFFAEVFATLARARHPRASSLVERLEAYTTAMSNPNTAVPRFSRHGLLMYRLGEQYLGKLSDKKLAPLEVLLSENESTYWYWDRGADRAIYAGLLLDRGDVNGATRILDGLLRDINPSSYTTSTQTKIQTLLAVARLSSRVRLDESISLGLSSQGLRGTIDLLAKELSDQVEFSRGALGESLSLTRTNSGSPLFYEMTEHDIPSNILTVKPRSSMGMEVSRVYELVDESRGIDPDGNWLITTPVTDGVFHKGKLYKVNLTVTPPKSASPTYYLTLEDLMPGVWRPIRGVFQTESRSTTDNQGGYYWNGWSHVEARDDRILATAESLWSAEPQTYTYYVRPEYIGEYLLPPITAYFMYRPEVYAIGRYERIQVKN